MTLRTAVIASIVWALVVVGIAGVSIWYVSSHPIRGTRMEDRAAQLGSGLGVLSTIGFGCIWLPYAAVIGKKKREEREKAKTKRKQKRRR